MATTPPTNNPFILSRATTPSDFASIITCEFLTFTDPFIREVFMGPDTPSNHKTLSAHYQHILHTNPADVWIKVEEKETGKIVGASNWRVHMGSVPEHQEEDLGWEWLRGDEEKLGRVKEVVRDITETRRRLFTEPYCRKYISVLDFLLISPSSPLRSRFLSGRLRISC
jgi:hypothetical protein